MRKLIRIIMIGFIGVILGNTSMTASASTWHSGNPYPFKSEKVWVSNFYKTKNGYTRVSTNISNKIGVNFNAISYTKHKKYINISTESYGADGGIHPQYKYEGHKNYLLVAGPSNQRIKTRIKIINKNKIAIYFGHTRYIFHPHNEKKINKIIYNK